jgi:hypothetical protein
VSQNTVLLDFPHVCVEIKLLAADVLLSESSAARRSWQLHDRPILVHLAVISHEHDTWLQKLDFLYL